MIRQILVTVSDGSGWVGDWAPGIGDPTWIGWFTTLAYLVTAALCYRTLRLEARRADRRAAIVWFALALAMLALGINKQLDLQTLFTELGKSVARAQGWYEERRVVQAVFIGLVLAVSLAASAVMLRLAGGALRTARLSLVGMVLLLGFIVIRAASFHHVDWLLQSHRAGLRVNALLELAGIACVALGARRAGAVSRRTPRSGSGARGPRRGS